LAVVLLIACVLLIGTAALVVLEGRVIFQLLKQQGRLVLRLEAVEAQLATRGTAMQSTFAGGSAIPTVGLPVGTMAPSFSLSGLYGGTLTLEALRAAGKPVILVFSDPSCSLCTALLPEFGRWERDFADKLTLAFLIQGTSAANYDMTTEHVVTQVLLQQDREVAQLYQVLDTPGAVLVRPDGTIGSPLAQGAEAIRTLVAGAVGLPMLQSHPMAASVNGNGTGASSLQNKHADPIVGVRMRTVREALQRGSIALKQTGHFDPQLDAQLLLAHALGVERKTLDAYIELQPAQEQRFLQLLERIRQGEPIAYLIGHIEFYGLDFLVDNRVLIPRPVTAGLVEAALSAVRHMLHAGRTPLVADLGTGSGVIAITLAVEEPRLPYLYATDLSADALEVAHLNCQRHGVEQRIHLLHGDLVAPLPEPVDIVVANLPYLRTNELDMVNPAARAHEPHLAFFGGPNGLELLQRFFVEAQQFRMLRDKAVLLLEIDFRQRETLTARLHEIWPQAAVSFSKDCFGVDRVLQVYL
jgi:release factor glutamine methyltransferase